MLSVLDFYCVLLPFWFFFFVFFCFFRFLYTLAWKIPWTEEPGGLQSMGSLRVGHD